MGPGSYPTRAALGMQPPGRETGRGRQWWRVGDVGNAGNLALLAMPRSPLCGPKSALMRRMNRLLPPFGVALLAAATVGAQSTSSAPQTGAKVPSATLTVTGCLRAGSEAGTFVLASSTPVSAAADTNTAGHHESPESKGTRPARAPAESTVVAGETLRLAGTVAKVNLADHVGHTVTVTGMIAPRDPVVTPGIVLPDARPPGDTTSREAGRGQDTPSGPRVLNIRSVTHVAGTCK